MTTSVVVRQRVADKELTTMQLAQRIKADFPRLGGRDAYVQFVRARALKPEIDAKTFIRLFEQALPDVGMRETVVAFAPTHYDTLTGLSVAASVGNTAGVVYLLFEDGVMGSDPAQFFAEQVRVGRYVRLTI